MNAGGRALALLVPACTAALAAACFGRALFGGDQFGYRDAAHFYYPLHQRIQREWDAGRWPLWEPEENGGMPLLGNPAAAVLYPGKIVFALAPYAWGARLYVVGHVLLAAASMFALLRSWRISAAGSALGALGYAFGGPVLFQCSNVIYLVGAAWAPLGVLAADRWVRLGSGGAVAGLAVVLALEFLGGDPETAYLTGLFSVAYAAVVALGGRERPRWLVPILIASAAAWILGTLAVARWGPAYRPATAAYLPRAVLPWMPWVGPVIAAAWAAVAIAVLIRGSGRRVGDRPALVPSLAGLALSAAMAAAIAAAQLLPVAEFVSRSGRSAADGSHEIQGFSLEPVRVVELLWPDVFGTSLTGSRSWLSAIRVDGKPPEMWTPSLYAGALMPLLALGAIGRRGAPPWHGWMCGIGAFSLAASFGAYAGPIWCARHVPAVAASIGGHDPADASGIRADGQLRDGDGGVYWALATFAPGFNRFRFPSKLLTFVALPMAALAGRGWDALASGDAFARRRVAAGAAVVVGLSCAGLVAARLGRDWFESRFEGRPVGSFGPLDSAGALGDLRRGLAQGGLVASVAFGLAMLKGRFARLAAPLALIVATADLATANAGLAATVPQRLFEGAPAVLKIIRDAERGDPSPGPFRIHRLPMWDPPAWSREASPDRLHEFVRWERDTLQAKYGIVDRISYTLSPGAAELRDYVAAFGGYVRRIDPATARSIGASTERGVVVHRRRAFDLWNTRYFVLPYHPGQWDDPARGFASFLARTELIYPTPETLRSDPGGASPRDWARTADFQVRINRAALPRAWVVHEVRADAWADGPGRDPMTDPLLFSEDDRWFDPARPVVDPRRVAWVDPADLLALKPHLGRGAAGPTESVRVARYESDRVELEATLDRPGLVVLADAHYPGWELQIDGRPAPIYRVNRSMRGAAVPPGSHALSFAFRPASFRVGSWISGAGLAALALASLRRPPAWPPGPSGEHGDTRAIIRGFQSS